MGDEVVGNYETGASGATDPSPPQSVFSQADSTKLGNMLGLFSSVASDEFCMGVS